MSAALDKLNKMNADFVVLPISVAQNGRFDDLVDIRGVPSGICNASVVGIINGEQNSRSREALGIQLSWANHAGMYAAMLQIGYLDMMELSAVISTFLSSISPECSVTRIWIRCKVGEWEEWNMLRTITSYPSKMSVFLDMTDMNAEPIISDRWLGEPVAAFSCDNVRKEYSGLILSLLRRNAQPVISTPEQLRACRDAISEFPALKWKDENVGPYHDSLQLPLQPLADHMENTVYETFEADRRKYDLYENAIHAAISNLISVYPEETSIRLAVVGAGRGGLIDSSVRAISRIRNDGLAFTITAVEKNPNAARTLRFRQRDDELWHSEGSSLNISIHEGDMRSWQPKEYMDILISELLGSLGDNEASPECLDGVIKFLDPLRGVSIPCMYYSTVEPVSCHKIWQTTRDSKKLETPLVVLFHNAFRPCEPKTLFSFEHVVGVPSSPHEQSQSLNWVLPVDTTVHGLAGYFHADLYGHVSMSIHPPTQSEEMISWFPAFLPFRDPVFVRSGESLVVDIRRRARKGEKMWVEWTVIAPTMGATNNHLGSTHHVGL